MQHNPTGYLICIVDHIPSHFLDKRLSIAHLLLLILFYWLVVWLRFLFEMVDYTFLERNFRNRKKQRDKEKNKKYLLSWWHSPPLLNQTALQFLPVHQCMLAFQAVLLPSASLLHPGGDGRRRGDWSQTALCQEKTTCTYSFLLHLRTFLFSQAIKPN